MDARTPNLAGQRSTRVAGLTHRGVPPKMSPTKAALLVRTMNMQQPHRPAPMSMTEELEARLQSLRKLRRQMLALHARLEYLRLMLRVSGPALPQAPPHGDLR
jgi:hypothetical protein